MIEFILEHGRELGAFSLSLIANVALYRAYQGARKELADKNNEQIIWLQKQAERNRGNSTGSD